MIHAHLGSIRLTYPTRVRVSPVDPMRGAAGGFWAGPPVVGVVSGLEPGQPQAGSGPPDPWALRGLPAIQEVNPWQGGKGRGGPGIQEVNPWQGGKGRGVPVTLYTEPAAGIPGGFWSGSRLSTMAYYPRLGHAGAGAAAPGSGFLGVSWFGWLLMAAAVGGVYYVFWRPAPARPRRQRVGAAPVPVAVSPAALGP